MQIDVVYCTDYRDRNVAPRLVQVGFALPTVMPEPATEVASD